MSDKIKLNLEAKAFVPKKQTNYQQNPNMQNQYMGGDNMNNQYGGYMNYPNQYPMNMPLTSRR